MRKIVKRKSKNTVLGSDGQYLAVGAEDGIVELFDARTGKSRTDLVYQDKENPMYIACEGKVTTVAFSNTGKLLAVGITDGQIFIFNVESGEEKHHIYGHEQAVLCIVWSHGDSQILTASADHTARVHGLNTLFVPDAVKVITASADGYVKVFDTKSQDNINTFSPPSAHLVAINDIKIAPDTDRSNPLLYVCTESNQVVKMNLTGQVLKTYSSQKADVGSEFRCITVSRKGKYLFAISKNGSLYTFDTQDGKLIHILPEIATKEIIGIASHPTRQGYLAAWSFDNTVALLKP